PGVAAAERRRRVGGGQVGGGNGGQRGAGGQALGVADRGTGPRRGLQTPQRAARGRRQHRGAAAPAVGHLGRRGRPDHRHVAGAGGRQRQHRPGVLEQGGAGLGHGGADRLMGGGGGRGRRPG